MNARFAFVLASIFVSPLICSQSRRSRALVAKTPYRRFEGSHFKRYLGLKARIN